VENAYAMQKLFIFHILGFNMFVVKICFAIADSWNRFIEYPSRHVTWFQPIKI